MTGFSRYAGTQLPVQRAARNLEQVTLAFIDAFIERRLLEREKQSSNGKRFSLSLYKFPYITRGKKWKKHLTLSLPFRHSINHYCHYLVNVLAQHRCAADAAGAARTWARLTRKLRSPITNLDHSALLLRRLGDAKANTIYGAAPRSLLALVALRASVLYDARQRRS